MCEYNLLNGYVGAKAAHAAKIKSLFDPQCTKYGEPFAGGASIFFSMPYGKYKIEGLNERNNHIANLYKLLSQNDTCAEVKERILSLSKPDDECLAREQFERASKFIKGNDAAKLLKCSDTELRINDAVNTFLVYTQSFNCSGKNYSSNKSDERYKNETRRNLLNAVERMQGSTELRICSVDGIALLEYDDIRNDEQRQLYIDPPYVGLYRDCNKLYQTEMAGLEEHIRLVKALAGCKCAVVLSGYRSQVEGVPTIYDAILGDEWRCLKLAETYKHCEIVKQGQKKRKAEEYVWTNRFPKAAENYFLQEDYKERLTMDEYWDRIKKAINSGAISGKEKREYELAYQKMMSK